MTSYVVDVNCLRGMNGEPVIKELAIVRFESSIQSSESFVFKPPYGWSLIPNKFRTQNKWITRNLHGIRWSEGYVPYSELTSIFARLANYDVYAKGKKATLVS